MAKNDKKGSKAETAAVDVARKGGKFARTKAVTLPVFKLADDVPVYLTATGEMYEGKEQKPAKAGEKPMEPATILPVVNVETGEVGQIIVGAVLEGILNETYPDGAYVGKSFEIVKHAKKEGKRYNTYSVFEIDPSAAAE